MKPAAIDSAFKAFQSKHPKWQRALAQTGARVAFERHFLAGATQERERIRRIHDLAQAGGVPPEYRGAVRIMQYDGRSTAEDVALLIAPPAGNLNAQDAKAGAEQLWDAVPAVRVGYDSRESYVAAKQAEATGRVRYTPPAAGLQRFTRES